MMTSQGPARAAGAAAMRVPSPVAVIGAGNVGCALAADLGLRGVEVRLFNRSPDGSPRSAMPAASR